MRVGLVCGVGGLDAGLGTARRDVSAVFGAIIAGLFEVRRMSRRDRTLQQLSYNVYRIPKAQREYRRILVVYVADRGYHPCL